MVKDGPPQLAEGSDYLRWKREVDIWTIGTSVAAAKQAATCILRITDVKARDYATRLSVEELKKTEGLKYLLGELDKFFAEDNTQCIFLAIEELEAFRRQDMTMLEYLAEFHRKVNKVQELMKDDEEVYHDSILAYKMLTQADLSIEDQKLVKAAMGVHALSTKVIEECLKRCFGDRVFSGEKPKLGESSSGTVKIKVEPQEALYASGREEEETYYQDRAHWSGRRRGRGKGRYPDSDKNYYQLQNEQGGKWKSDKQSYNRRRNQSERDERTEEESRCESLRSEQLGCDALNSINPRTGEVYRCNVCDSNRHFKSRCPHRNSR